ncbi:MAG: tRNA (N(6)-L-threonylcarbamoyladenosine(37)-C(2))-methylthiotransferase [Candidatus Bilamarchaeaceae archaeon]
MRTRSRPARVFVRTYGCTLNQADSDIIAGLLRREGFRISSSEKQADVVVLNTCTVKAATENKTLNELRRLSDGRKKVVVAGCMAVLEKRIRAVSNDAPIVWPGAVEMVPEAVKAVVSGRKPSASDPMVFKSFLKKDELPRIFTKPILRMPMQEGCASACFFCQTRLARPRMVSYSPKTIVRNIEEGLRKGAREVQLTGMDAGAYGMDLGGTGNGMDLVSLMHSINSIGVPAGKAFRVRLGMINPNHAKRMLKGIASELGSDASRFYKFIHIPVQTGSEKVCREMNRPHTVKDFADAVNFLRKEIHGISIATDIIVGYPTETEGDFEQTLALIRSVKPDVVNLSKFTPREGTRAKAMKQLDSAVVKRRSEVASELVKEICAGNNREYVGKALDVMVTEKGKGKSMKGRSFNYKQVVVISNPKTRSGIPKIGSFVKARIISANHGSLIGELESLRK